MVTESCSKVKKLTKRSPDIRKIPSRAVHSMLPPTNGLRIEFDDVSDAPLEKKPHHYLHLHGKRADAIAETKAVDPGEVVLQENGLVLTRRALACLNDREWLNDEVINFLVAKLRLDADKDTWIPNTFFFPAVLRGSPVDRWADRAGVNWKTLRCIIIPVHRVNHWAICSVDIREKKLMYYDSIGQAPPCFKKLIRYVSHNLGLPSSTSWRVKFSSAAKQTNDYDCGLYACLYMACQIHALLPGTCRWKTEKCLRSWLRGALARPGSIFAHRREERHHHEK